MHGRRLSLYSQRTGRGKPVLAPLRNFALNACLIAMQRCVRIATLLQNRAPKIDSKLANREWATYSLACKIPNLAACGPAKEMFRFEVVRLLRI